MTFLKLAEKRQTIRKYDSDKPVEDEKLQRMLKTLVWAPTAKNRQSQKVYVLQSKEALNKINDCTPCIYGAPIVFLICFDKNSEWVRPFDEYEGGWFDASIAAMHIMMQATNDGLGTVWVENFDPEIVRKTFNLPENIVPAVLLPVGYPAADCPESLNHRKSRPLSEMVKIL